MNVAEIAREYGVVVETVRRALRKKGLKARRVDGRLALTQKHMDYLRDYFESPYRQERVPKKMRVK
jgi:DeoR/GlpR family transcriptional regulator of sugar metabolism